MRNALVTMSAVALAFGLDACADRPATGPDLTLAVAPLTLPNVGYACYDLAVDNDRGQRVWEKGDPDTHAGHAGGAICSDRYGAAGGVSYVGTCDASDTVTSDEGVAIDTATLWVDGLYGDNDADIGGWRDPCPDGCALRVPCAEDADRAVSFDLTIMRDAAQGFFDVAVSFSDIFCSAKVDVVASFLHDPAAGTRGPTAILAFACTSGAGATPTTLYMDDIAVTCAGSEHYAVRPTGAGEGPGQMPGLFATSVYHAKEALAGYDKCYWNTALGLDVSLGADADRLGASCVLSTDLSAGEAAFSEHDGAFWSPSNAAYPVVHVAVALTDAAGAPRYGAHPLNVAGSGVTTGYSDFATPVGYTLAMSCGASPAAATGAAAPGAGGNTGGDTGGGDTGDDGDTDSGGGGGDTGGGGTPQLFCGDTFVTGDEECDPPGVGTCLAGCVCGGDTIPDGLDGCWSCGNGLRDDGPTGCEPIGLAGQHCDGDTCQCTGGWAPDGVGGCGYCGDGKLENGETCDPGFDPAGCAANCRCAPGFPSDGAGHCGYAPSGETFHAIQNVATWGDDALGDGSDAHPFKSLHVAIAHATSGDGVRVWPGTYRLVPQSHPTQSYTSAGIYIPAGKTLHVWGANENTILELHCEDSPTIRDCNFAVMQANLSKLTNLTLRYWPTRDTAYSNAVFAWPTYTAEVRNVAVENMSSTKSWSYLYDNGNTNAPQIYNSIFVSHQRSIDDWSGTPLYYSTLFDKAPSNGTRTGCLTRATITAADYWSQSLPADLQHAGAATVLNRDGSRSHIGTGGGVEAWTTLCAPDGSPDGDGDGHPDSCDACPADATGDLDGDGDCQ